MVTVLKLMCCRFFFFVFVFFCASKIRLTCFGCRPFSFLLYSYFEKRKSSGTREFKFKTVPMNRMNQSINPFPILSAQKNAGMKVTEFVRFSVKKESHLEFDAGIISSDAKLHRQLRMQKISFTCTSSCMRESTSPFFVHKK